MTHVFRVGVAETSTTTGTANFVLAGRVYGALAGFFDVMSVGDTCDYVARYGDTREEGIATRLVSGELERTSIHANGTIDQNKVSFPAGAKHVWMSIRGDRVAAFLDALRPQSFTQGQRDQACANLGMPQSGNKIIIPEATAWVGWTKDTTHHNKAIRIVNDTNGGSAGGSVDFDVLQARTATDNFTITQASLPNVNFNIAAGQGGHPHDYDVTTNIAGGTFTFASSAGPGGKRTTDVAVLPSMVASSGGSGTAFSAAIDMRVKYLNCISVIKD